MPHLRIGMMSRHIYQQICDGESEVLDFKKTITSSIKIAKNIVAFANTKGGTLLVGVNDNGSIAGVRTEEEKYMLDMAAGFFCRPEIFLEINQIELDGKEILEVKVPEGNEKPYYAKDEAGKWWAYIRVHDKCLQASKVMLEVLKRKSSARGTILQLGTKENGILSYLKTHEKITLPEICRMLNISRWRAQKILVNLVSIGALRVHDSGKAEFYTI